MAGNIAHMLLRHVEGTPTRVLYRHYVDDAWCDVTAAEIAAQAARWQAAFRREGLQPGDRVALCLRNGVTWVAIDQAALAMQLVVVPLYVDDNADNVAWCAGNAQARLLVVENSRIAKGLVKIEDPAQPLPPRVIVRPDENETGATLANWLPPATGGFMVADVDDSTLATICYTSGTAGRPKGVMLSHGNILANVEQCRATNMAREDDLFLSILPLSHMFERTGGYYLPLAVGARVAYSRGVAQIADDLESQKPTAMFAVPRIFERFRARIEQSLAASSWKKRLFESCVSRGFRVASGHGNPLDHLLAPLLRKLVAAPVLAKLGGRLRLVVVGGAALDPGLARSFIGLGLPLLQGYGMTEASPVISVNHIDDNVPESVGPPMTGMELRFGGGGELLVRGPNVMQGYWRNPEATAAVLRDGWLHTGDVAELKDGRIFIRGRAKDILVLSNGEKLPPQDAEFAILRDPVFEQVMLVGEGRPFVVLLAVSKETDDKVLVRRANDQLKAFPRWVRVRKVVSSVEPWSVDNGLLTPTLKLRRPLLLKQREKEIEAAYTGTAE